MSISKYAVAVAAFTVVAGSAFAGTNVVGSWKGKLKFDLSKVPAEQKQMAQQKIAMLSKMTFGLTLVKNGKFTMQISGFPTQPGGKTPPPQTGSWSIKGGQLSLIPDAPNAQMKPPPQVFIVSKDGKSFSASQGNGSAVITFSR
jgi:hypothetical protein